MTRKVTTKRIAPRVSAQRGRTYTIRRTGHAAWAAGLNIQEVPDEARRAQRHARGHRVFRDGNALGTSAVVANCDHFDLDKLLDRALLIAVIGRAEERLDGVKN